MSSESPGLTPEQLDTIGVIVRRLDETVRSCATVEEQVHELATYVAAAGRITADAMALDDQILQRQGEEVQRLAARVEEAHAAIATLRGELAVVRRRAHHAPAESRFRPQRVTSARSVAGALAAAAVVVLAAYIVNGRGDGVPASPPLVSTLRSSVVATAGVGTSGVAVTPARDITPAAPAATGSPVRERRARAAAQPRLVVTSSPAGARVTVNGIGWGSTPATIKYLPPGPKRIRVLKDGYVGEERTVVLTGDQPAHSLRLTLRPAVLRRSRG